MNRTTSILAATFAIAAVAGLGFSAVQASAGYGEKHKEKPSIVEIATSSDQFSTLVAALKAADLVGALQAEGKTFTVFAPTNEAFEKLPEGTLETLLKPENKQKLQSILLYHVASGKSAAGDVVEKDQIKTLQGQALEIEVRGNAVMIDGAKVLKADVMASNGVIHVIDSVVLPE
jgi:uncharacterized surface protein with fasciclin (FAS1) repeats